MLRRSFLRGLMAAPVAVPAVAKSALAAPVPPIPVRQLPAAAADLGPIAVGRICSADGRLAMDFSEGRIVIRGDLIADGQITAHTLPGALAALGT